MQLSILFLLPQFSGGGAERVTINLLTELHDRGYSVGIIVFNQVGPLMSMVSNDIPIYNLGTLTLKSSIIPLVKKLRQLNPKVIYSTLGYINVALLAIQWLLPRKTEIWIREANLPSISLPNNSQSKLMPILYRLLYRKSNRLICTSIKMRDEFIFDFKVPKRIIGILPNPVDVEAIRISALQMKRFDKGGVCYVAAGRLVFQKGFDRLLCWFSELEDKKSTLTILGDGNLKDELAKEAELLNLQDRVIFLGFCNNPWQWYAGADVFLLSSRWEGMPNSVLEALVCGTPVIATEESGGIKEVVDDSETNSVNIATNPQEFIHFMNKVNKKNRRLTHDSLLPKRYRKENVIFIIERWLKSDKISSS